MDAEKLKEKLKDKGISIPKAAEKIGIGKKAFYEKIYGERQFKQKEIADLAILLELTKEEIFLIFFSDFGVQKDTLAKGETNATVAV